MRALTLSPSYSRGYKAKGTNGSLADWKRLYKVSSVLDEAICRKGTDGQP